MAFNNYYPTNYTQGFQQSYPQGYPQQQNFAQQNFAQQRNGINWVQGLEGAKAYPVMAGNDGVVLFDSDSDRFFIKSADQTGMPRMRIFNYQEVGQPTQQEKETQQIDMSGYVTKEELEERLSELLQKKTTKKKEVKSDAE